MPKDTRSRTTLPGHIREYLVENSNSSTMPDPAPAVNPEQLDMQTLLTMMTRTLGAFSESRAPAVSKLEVCPVKRMSSSLDSWMNEVLLWDESNSSNTPGWNAKKYLKFLESVFKSEGCDDLKNLIQVEFVENESFDKNKDSVIKFQLAIANLQKIIKIICIWKKMEANKKLCN